LPKSKPTDEAISQYSKGKQAFDAGSTDDAFNELKKAYHSFKDTSEQVVIADIQRMLGELYFIKGDLIESRNYYKKAYFSFKISGNKIGMADCYDSVAISFMLQSEYNYAKEYQEKAIKIRQKTADKKGLARGLKNLAIIIYKMENNHGKALDLLTEALDLAKKAKDQQLIINISLDQSKILSKIGSYEEALRSFILARRLSKEHSLKLPDEQDNEFGDLMLNIGLKKYDEGDLEEALKYLKNASLIYQKNNNPLFETIDPTIQKIEALISKGK